MSSNVAMSAPRVYTIADLMSMLRLSRATVYNKVNRGVIPGRIRVEGIVRIDKAAFDAWYTEQQDEAR